MFRVTRVVGVASVVVTVPVIRLVNCTTMLFDVVGLAITRIPASALTLVSPPTKFIVYNAGITVPESVTKDSNTEGGRLPALTGTII